MNSSEGLCIHERIIRNCYTCHIQNNHPKEKSELDTLHETISEFKVRVSKLEEYKRLQDDINKQVTEYKQDFLNLYEFYYKLDDHRKRQIDENRAVSRLFDNLEKDIKKLKDGSYERDNKIMREVEESSKRWNVYFLDSFNERITKLENSPFGKSPIYEPLFKRLHELELEVKKIQDYQTNARVLINNEGSQSPKTTALTFEEAITALKNGKKIKRKEWGENLNPEAAILVQSLLENDWEIIE